MAPEAANCYLCQKSKNLKWLVHYHYFPMLFLHLLRCRVLPFFLAGFGIQPQKSKDENVEAASGFRILCFVSEMKIFTSPWMKGRNAGVRGSKKWLPLSVFELRICEGKIGLIWDEWVNGEEERE
ncbi:hypothetical protein ERO13_D13G191350v2 [Gossypium hirsutum]|nr:hypothetical protein ERO13_D13G191350v2 [Gossypium hirsutum]